MAKLTDEKLAEICGVSRRSITAWRVEGAIPAGASLERWANFLAHRETQRSGTLRERLNAARAQKLERENLRALREFLPLGEVQFVFGKAISLLAESLQSLAARCAPADEHAQRTIEAEVRRARNEFANELNKLALSKPTMAQLKVTRA